MNRLKELFHLTEQIEALLDSETINRDEVIDEITKLIGQRDDFIKSISSPYSKEEQIIGKKLVEMNTRIQQKMDSVFTELKLEMKQIKQQKKSNRSYTNPYEYVQSMDGMFMDNKK